MLDMEFKSMSGKPTTVPVIDFSESFDPAKRSSICAQVARACETVGFFEIINSGIPLKVLDNAFDVSREFYDLSLEEKLTLKPKPGYKYFNLGYKHFPIRQGVENRTEDISFYDYHMQPEMNSVYESVKSYSNGSSGDDDTMLNWWPNNPGDYRVRMERLFAEFGKLADTLQDVFSESLGLPPTYFREHHHKNATVPRYISSHHYPKGTESKEGETGIIAHRDSSVFTIVSQSNDAEGLQINPYGEWIPVFPQRGGLIINVGDVLQVWTNGRYRSILHRVISNKKEDRYSIGYFLLPSIVPGEDNYIVKPISKLITKESPSTYVPFSYLDFFRNKMLKNSVSMLKTYEVAINA